MEELVSYLIIPLSGYFWDHSNIRTTYLYSLKENIKTLKWLDTLIRKQKLQYGTRIHQLEKEQPDNNYRNSWTWSLVSLLPTTFFFGFSLFSCQRMHASSYYVPFYIRTYVSLVVQVQFCIHLCTIFNFKPELKQLFNQGKFIRFNTCLVSLVTIYVTCYSIIW